MITGTGTLILRDGRRIELAYRFAANYDDHRAGFLMCDTPSLDPAILFDRLKVVCDDGTTLIVAVMHHSDKYLAVTGRVVSSEEAVA